ncbi:hypothetical protein Daura_39725 [Dactylosporangium aurantiacum]|uniref:Lipoprotein n=1 Tax=Dactylosporangium aurantiacum TaxID=35754 RepID=A0A9Q9ICJ7_9ACTN|nr:DUF6636 domain-containing protein [Dactylosporangium aurantiacum]MDG6101446.1 hypothetical protein [Dactylosporangium aurantiacum]UWZ52701.1 hypothetical protein Daura_39725 [Dactylosporangium aurantiacum]
MRHRTTTLPLILAAAALALSACDPAPKPTTAAPAPPSPAAPAAPASVTSVASAPVVTETSDVKDGVVFRTPSANIGCGVFPDSVRCTILTKTWTPPPAPADCDLDWGSSLGLDPQHGATLVRAGDSAFTPDAKVIAYGHALRVGTVLCTSTETHLRCESVTTKHGFTVAKETYTVF